MVGVLVVYVVVYVVDACMMFMCYVVVVASVSVDVVDVFCRCYY